MEKIIKNLRLFFKTTNAAFSVLNAVKEFNNQILAPSKIHQLHKMGLEEIEKEEPDMIKINSIIREIESLCNPIPNYPDGSN